MPEVAYSCGPNKPCIAGGQGRMKPFIVMKGDKMVMWPFVNILCLLVLSKNCNLLMKNYIKLITVYALGIYGTCPQRVERWTCDQVVGSNPTGAKSA